MPASLLLLKFCCDAPFITYDSFQQLIGTSRYLPAWQALKMTCNVQNNRA